MSSPIIILGAGASHDYYSIPHPPIVREMPPLANDLVNPVNLNSKISKSYPEVEALIAELAHKVVNGKQDLEECLNQIKIQFGSQPHRQIQLIAFQFYLHELFKEISNRINPFNNYKTLITRIFDYCNGEACIATFNYDTLLEKSLDNVRYSSINDYIGPKLNLIKLHGSCDWVYVRNRADFDFEYNDISNIYEYLKKFPAFFEQLSQGNVSPYPENQVAVSTAKGAELVQFPAIAMPLPYKQAFVCPENHINKLKNFLNQTDRILIIGWSARDPNLIELLENELKNPIALTVVCHKEEDNQGVIKKLEHIDKIDKLKIHSIEGGFTGFINNDTFCKKFFGR